LTLVSGDLSQVVSNVRAYLVVLLGAMENAMQVLPLKVWCDDIGMTSEDLLVSPQG